MNVCCARAAVVHLYFILLHVFNHPKGSMLPCIVQTAAFDSIELKPKKKKRKFELLSLFSKLSISGGRAELACDVNAGHRFESKSNYISINPNVQLSKSVVSV